MPPICNANAIFTCPHQGGVAKAIPKQFQVNIGGAPALRIADVVGYQFMPGCPNLPTPGTPSNVPCLTIISPGVPPSTKVLIGGMPALLATATMTSNCVVPIPNGVRIQFPGQTQVIAAS
jgi:hypothetical protein